MHALCCGRFWQGYIGTSWHSEEVWHDAKEALTCKGRLLGLDPLMTMVEYIVVVLVAFVKLVLGGGQGGHVEPGPQYDGHGPIMGDVIPFTVMLLDVWQSTNLSPYLHFNIGTDISIPLTA